MLTEPESGRIRSRAIRMVVVLPEPFGPRNPKISPRCSSKETPFTTRRPPNVLTSSHASRAGLAGELDGRLGVSNANYHLTSIVPVPVRPVNGHGNELIAGKWPTRSSTFVRTITVAGAIGSSPCDTAQRNPFLPPSPAHRRQGPALAGRASPSLHRGRAFTTMIPAPTREELADAPDE